jgi:hypothetical protein
MPQPNLTRIAVLEHDLLGVKPIPGTAAAAILSLRRAGTCIEHDATDVSTFDQGSGFRIICIRCGNYLMPTEIGGWKLADVVEEGTLS